MNMGDGLGKPFKTLDEQIDILVKRNLIVKNKEQAKYLLTKHSYYSVINGYKDIFLKKKQSKFEEDCYEDDTTLTDIINLHDFDKKIRIEILSALENIESTLATNINYIFAERFGENQEQYLNPKNFKPGSITAKGKSQRDILIEELKKICTSNNHPMKHYRENHYNIPPWILVKGATFGNLLYIYKLFRKEEKDYLICRCLGISKSEIDEDLKEFFIKMLEIFWRYRNWAAHGGRMYSHKVREQLPYYSQAYDRFEIVKTAYNKGQGRNDIFALFIGIAFFFKSDATAYLNFAVGINFYIEKYSKEYKKYGDRVIKQMGLPLDYSKCLFENLPDVNHSTFLNNINSQLFKV
ncbi:Abi family protein [Peribacillus phoenicis]|uniref:Abi family protein n=1 Tax=unclassified Peribacillus TaxID=2675266 RepID=UPI00399EF599